ncbi:hypothetical protein ADUPG1_010950 [Aduncisulcus paluster]|uniref:Rab-GAP TBC domain-containing protein n=1 Tax=Aduncisulcus paluster TaxID=2918883 RepID=A0ABQ5JUH9_9EUKA|nr:hypothetical protein ADUPG1_010950 [Aduncisulcus paluster]|eukprot:gnl/Carplike_NY0171/5342_a7292_366.p1 GENE.gnl/Carplike_NY0171/5342_a7292_366~~gnl/Carplike_NY0171/5342_a7292_366.p1  ORF type:complete len:443 (+),score=50.50 gnl/Carplike_NY0171/5342_a7292_366:29-1357(+)
MPEYDDDRLYDQHGFLVTIPISSQLRARQDTQRFKTKVKWITYLQKYYKSYPKGPTELSDKEVREFFDTYTPNKIDGHEMEIKLLCREGIPSQFRPHLWMRMSFAKHNMSNNPGLYKDLCEKSKDIDTVSTRQITLDISRTFTGHRYLCEPDTMDQIARVLRAFSIYNESVGYCQSMNFICAFLFLFFENEEEVFWMLNSVVDDLLPGYFSQVLAKVQVDSLVVQFFLKKYCPKVYSWLITNHCDLRLFLTSWLMCIFTTKLPSITTVRLWDTLFSEGDKILFRTSIALFILLERRLIGMDKKPSKFFGKTYEIDDGIDPLIEWYTSIPIEHIPCPVETPGHFKEVLESLLPAMYNADLLIDTAFNGLGTFMRHSINSQRQKIGKEILKETAEQVKRRIERMRRLGGDVETVKQLEEWVDSAETEPHIETGKQPSDGTCHIV